MAGARAPFRLPRAAAVAVTVLVLGAAAHVMAGGELPALPVMTALTAVVALSAVMLAGRKMTAPVLAAYLGASQTGLHLAFSALSGVGTPMPGMAVHHPGMKAGTGGPGASIAHDHLSADVSLGMLGMHLTAVLLTALVMARGESALWALAAWLRPLMDPPEPAIIRVCRYLAVTAAATIQPRGRVTGRPPARGPPLRVPAGTL